MITATLARPDDFDAWRETARALVARNVPPEHVIWQEAGDVDDLFGTANASLADPATTADVRVSRRFLALAGLALLHKGSPRLPLLYRLLWRLQDTPRLLDDPADPDVVALHRLVKPVQRDIHKMRAFVRFRAISEADGGERFVAWFEPDHRIERHNARFFIDRFANQRWSILTPRLSLHWDGKTLNEAPGARREDAPADDAAEELWLGYYRSIFNPARLKVQAMCKEMPRKYWHNLPEARAIGEMIAGAQQREARMIARGTDMFDRPRPESIAAVAAGIAACRGCAIGCNGTRAVAGAGPPQATLMIVGEQPGDTEEQVGQPFVGPAGQLLDRELERAGIDRGTAYVTNAVKHFKFVARGERRLHQNPTAGEIDKCRWWLDAERALVRPRITLALGASAARGLIGRTPSVGRERGTPIRLSDESTVLITSHPSYLLRLDGTAREREQQRFRNDLNILAAMLKEPCE